MERVLVVGQEAEREESTLDSEGHASRGAVAVLERDDVARTAGAADWDADDCLADGRGDGDLIFGDDGSAL